MARSIHETWRSLGREQRWKDDTEAHRERLKAHFEALVRKGRIKDSVRTERRRRRGPGRGVPAGPTVVSVHVADEGPHVLHGASPEDVRAVIERLPAGALTGVKEIVLGLGAPEGDARGRDPIFGRPGSERFPGLWTSPFLGFYYRRRGCIRLHACVLVDDLCQPDFTVPFLRLRALSTLVHEVAHHDDFTLRVARGRWRADDKEKDERHADRLMDRWTRESVVPYLEAAHPGESAALRTWTLAHAGVELPLAALVGAGLADDPDLTAGGHVCLSALADLVTEVERGANPGSVRLCFAAELVDCCGQERLAGRVLDSIAQDGLKDDECGLLHAYLLDRLGRCDESVAILRFWQGDEAPSNEKPWLVALHNHAWGRWRDVVAMPAESLQTSITTRGWVHAARAHAWLELGEPERLTTEVRILLRTRERSLRTRARGLWAIGLLRTGALDRALRVAESGLALASTLWTTWAHELLAVRFDVLTRRGEPARPLASETLARLRSRGHGAWADELAGRPWRKT